MVSITQRPNRNGPPSWRVQAREGRKLFQLTLSNEVEAKALGADVDKYGWSAAVRLREAGVRPLGDDDVSQLGLLRAGVAQSSRADWNIVGHRAVMRNDLAVAVEWEEFDVEWAEDTDPKRTRLQLFWNASMVDEVHLDSVNGTYLPSPWAWGKGYAVSVWEHAAARFMDALIGYGFFDEEFEKSGVTVRNRLPRHR